MEKGRWWVRMQPRRVKCGTFWHCPHSITGAVTPRGIGDSGGRAPAIGTVAPVGTEGPGGGFLATDGVALERGVTVP